MNGMKSSIKLGLLCLTLVGVNSMDMRRAEETFPSTSTTTVKPEATTENTSGRILSLPTLEKCKNRTFHFSLDGHGYFYSRFHPDHEKDKVDWLEARNTCREYCMDLVSLETPTEDEMIKDFLVKEDLPYIWTSGRLCNFKGCDREDLQPTNVNGWFWSGSGVKMAPTNSTPPGWSYQPWSPTGHKSQFSDVDVPQPDNAEFDINGSVEACMGLLNDIYEDGVKWHDIACYHTKPYICEDSDQLLKYIRDLHPTEDIAEPPEDLEVEV